MGEAIRHPPSDGNDNLEPWIRLLQRDQTHETGFAIRHRRPTCRCDPRKRKVYVRELLGMYHRGSRPARDVGHDSIRVSRRRGFPDLCSQNSSCKARRANENAEKKQCAMFHGGPRCPTQSPSSSKFSGSVQMVRHTSADLPPFYILL